MTVAPTRAQSGPVDAPVAPPRVVRQRRVRPGLLGLAVLLVALGGLGSAFAVTSVRATGSYLAVARPVQVGAILTADDVTRVEVAGGQGLAPVAASRLGEVIGKRAAVTLTPGTLLTAGQFTDKPLLGPGQQQVAISLRVGAVPAKRLRPGDKLLLIGLPDQSRTGGTDPAGTRFESTVIDTAYPDNSSVVIYVALAVRDVPAVVALNAGNRVAVVLTSAA
ncbi:SAF domain-containing protein [Micromonospora sp. NBC_01699]|uniref:SAF domain-containing protein n=1 Tax=Micromonospora sp. NBC_01699 TaxID=2975984 RepID=UPI002E2DF41E|nr:SAF domain-containing protein [Micromonospora sp. NBC_01699]